MYKKFLHRKKKLNPRKDSILYITGEIASGKSYVAKILNSIGCRIMQSDLLGKRIEKIIEAATNNAPLLDPHKSNDNNYAADHLHNLQCGNQSDKLSNHRIRTIHEQVNIIRNQLLMDLRRINASRLVAWESALMLDSEYITSKVDFILIAAPSRQTKIEFLQKRQIKMNFYEAIMVRQEKINRFLKTTNNQMAIYGVNSIQTSGNRLSVIKQIRILRKKPAYNPISGA